MKITQTTHSAVCECGKHHSLMPGQASVACHGERFWLESLPYNGEAVVTGEPDTEPAHPSNW